MRRAQKIEKALRELVEVIETDERDYGTGEYHLVFSAAMKSARMALLPEDRPGSGIGYCS